MHIVQLFISIPLFLFLAFGIGFVLNMLIKTTWLPLIMYLMLIMFLFIRMGVLLPVDYIILVSGLAGAVLSGVVIRMLRARGYRMF